MRSARQARAVPGTVDRQVNYIGGAQPPEIKVSDLAATPFHLVETLFFVHSAKASGRAAELT